MAKVNVLVVDDASFIRDLVKKGLRDNFPGIQIEEAINGRKAQQMLARTTIDLILCDWEMPEMSGLELLTWCREQDHLKATPFIMVTSRGDKENVIQAIQAGVTDYIGKPFSNDQLVTKVKRALSRSGKLEALMSSAPVKLPSAGGFANESLAALTGGKAEVVRPAAAPVAAAPVAKPAVPAPSAKSAAQAPGGRGQAQLRLPAGVLACVIKALSLKDAQLVVRAGDPLPQVLESAVLDLEQGEGGEVARLNGYLHSVAALESKPDSEWLLLTFRFVDRDPQKLDYLSRLIARGTAQKHFVPGA
ncbi:two-component system response regulator [Metapseudomonas resinovorans]|uniref:response regulator n=1 Tax=Metapseudomonas resinovorans TaxID=53412 RepID=UPI0009862CF0|nr:response regulator [Pseudomonas resinovorans]GLZ89503.1 two-component system response regulator [Pseudomonas resinovorans]